MGLFEGQGDRVDLQADCGFPIYSGGFKQSLFHGRGTLMSEDKCTLLKGCFNEGKLEGLAVEKKFDSQTEEEVSEKYFEYRGNKRVKQIFLQNAELEAYLAAQKEFTLTLEAKRLGEERQKLLESDLVKKLR